MGGGGNQAARARPGQHKGRATTRPVLVRCELGVFLLSLLEGEGILLLNYGRVNDHHIRSNWGFFGQVRKKFIPPVKIIEVIRNLYHSHIQV